jgi:hypothetical protein
VRDSHQSGVCTSAAGSRGLCSCALPQTFGRIKFDHGTVVLRPRKLQSQLNFRHVLGFLGCPITYHFEVAAHSTFPNLLSRTDACLCTINKPSRPKQRKPIKVRAQTSHPPFIKVEKGCEVWGLGPVVWRRYRKLVNLHSHKRPTRRSTGRFVI